MTSTRKNGLKGKVSTEYIGKNKFFYGYSFPVIVSFLVFIFWMLNLQLLGLSVVVGFASYLFFTQKDFTPVLPLLLMAPMCFRDMNVFSSPFTFVLFGLVAFALVVNLIRFPLKIKKLSFLSWAFMLLTLSMLLGGISTWHFEHYLFGLPHVAFLSVAMFAEHIVITHRIVPKKFFDLRKYLCFIFIIATNLACMQLIFAKTSIALYGYTQFHFNGANFIGWANTIHIGYMALFSLPLCCYFLITTKKYFIPIAIEILFIYFSAFVTESDGTLGLMAILTPLLAIFVGLKIPNANYKKYKLFVYSLILLFFICELLFVIFFDLSEFIDKVVNIFKDDNGRSDVYYIAIRMFKRNPLFGTGFGCGFVAAADYTGYYHSTFFHVLANLGVFGIIAYSVLYIARFKVLTGKHTVFNFLATISFFAFALFAMIDNGEFHFLVIHVTALVSVVEVANKKDNENPLPLFTRRDNRVEKFR